MRSNAKNEVDEAGWAEMDLITRNGEMKIRRDGKKLRTKYTSKTRKTESIIRLSKIVKSIYYMRLEPHINTV